MFKITEINKNSQFFKLKYKWNELLERSVNNNIFLTWEWCSTYWKHYGKGKKLIILSIEKNNDEIVAIAPLKQSNYRFLNLFGYNIIEPIGCGLTDYNDFLLKERKVEYLKLFIKYLYGHHEWDFIYLSDIPETSIILDYLPKIFEFVQTLELEKGVICPYISIPNFSDVFIKNLSKSFRYNLSRQMRRLKKNYNKVDVKRYDEFSTVKESMKVFFELHQQRWISKGMPGIFSYDEARNFHLDVAKIFADKDWLGLYFLIVDEKPIASLYGFEYNQKMYLYLGGFDVDFSQYSPSNLLLLELIKKCIQNGITEIDFMRGSEQHKFKWGSNYRMNYNIKFVNEKLVSKLYYWIIKSIKKMNTMRIQA